jgi:hypothetical protein
LQLAHVVGSVGESSGIGSGIRDDGGENDEIDKLMRRPQPPPTSVDANVRADPFTSHWKTSRNNAVSCLPRLCICCLFRSQNIGENKKTTIGRKKVVTRRNESGHKGGSSSQQ